MAIEVSFDGGRKVNATINGFTVKTDQSVRNGGEGSAPEPFSLFLASLATCAGIYVKSFCDQRDIPTGNLSLTMDYEYDTVAKMIARILIDIHVPADFPEKYEQAVISAASLCAVKRHLSDKVQSEVRIRRKDS